MLTLFANQASIAIDNARLFQNLAEERTRLRLVLDSASEAIYGADTDGICTFVNPACLRMLGYEREDQLIGRNMHALIHHSYPDGRPYPKEECPVGQTIRRGREGHDNEVHWRADGTSFPVEYWSKPMIRDGQLVGYVVSFTDITERKRSEAALRESEQHYRTLANSGSTLIWTSGLDKLCDYFNEPWFRFTGRTLAQEIGNGWMDGVHPDDLDACRRTYVTAFEQRQPFSMEYRLRHADGAIAGCATTAIRVTTARASFSATSASVSISPSRRP